MCLFLFRLLITICLMCLVNRSLTAPPDYCLHQPNTTDCGEEPRPMYYYYKPGSRCELKIWRGCPSYNVFDTQALCAHVCLFPFISSPGEAPESEDTCRSKLNVNKCTNQKTKVYTYDKISKTCLPAIWRGCNTSNLFINEADCLEICKATHSPQMTGTTPSQPVQTTSDFGDRLKLLGPKVVDKLSDVLDAITPSRLHPNDSEVATKASEDQKDSENIADVTTGKQEAKPTETDKATTEALPITASIDDKPVTAPLPTTAAAQPTTILETTTEASSYEGDIQEVMTP